MPYWYLSLCYLPEIVHGGYSSWGQWGACGVSCGGGLRTRVRTCTNPPPQHGGNDCDGTGSSQEQELCNSQICCQGKLKVHLTPKYFFRLNNSLHLFETHCAFLHLFSPNLDFLQAVKVTKSDHHLFHDRASKGYGSIPGLMSQTYLHACLQRLNTMQISLWRQPRYRPIPLTSSVVQQMMARFRNFYSL